MVDALASLKRKEPQAYLMEACRVLVEETRRLLRLDLAGGIVLLVFLSLFLPTIGRYAQSAPMLASFMDDEPLITMQLDGMTARPYGDPANYLDTGSIKKKVPSYWYNIRYTNIPYYGGVYPDLAFVLWVPLKLAGLPLFPTGPIILRGLALLFSAAALLALYNFCRVHLGRFAALAGVIALLSDFNFIGIGTVIHPDSLLLFICFLGLALCVRHAREGDLGSLVAIGIAAGLAQGTKMGGPLLVPITVAAVLLGLRAEWDSRRDLKHAALALAQRGLLVAAVAVAVFILTTPYAILDPYYLDTWKLWARQFTGSVAASPTGFWDWVRAFEPYLGPVLLIAAGLALLGRLIFRRRFGDPLALGMFALLAATVFLWYAGLQKYWVQLQYLTFCVCFVSAMAGHLADQLLGPILARATPRGRASVQVIAVLALVVAWQGKIYGTLEVPVRYAEWRHSSQLLPGLWLAAHRPDAQGKVLFDTEAYFDPGRFHEQFMNGGPIKYTDLAHVLPDYFTLTFYPFANWMSQDMAHQNNSKWDSNYFSMRLYQDLLGRDPDKLAHSDPQRVTLGEVPGIEHLMSFGTGLPTAENSCIPANPGVWTLAKWSCAARVLCGGACGYTNINMTREVFLFRLDSAEFLKQVPKELH